MKNKLQILVCFVMLAFTYSCKEEVATIEKQTYTKDEIELVSKLKETSLTLCNIVNSPEVVTEVNSIVKINIDYGRDEEARFRDLIGAEKSVFFDETTKQKSPALNRVLRSKVASIYEYLVNNDIQIYWPYSENWDGISTPLITYAPFDENQTTVYAYKANANGLIDSVLIDENYAKNNPVWIINQNETSYKELPAFSKKQYVKNGVLFLSPKANSKRVKYAAPTALNDPNSIYNISLGKVKATEQWDTWMAGGSEFRFRMVGAIPSGTTGVISDYSVGVIAVEFTRKEIGKKVTKDINSLINIDWAPDETFNGFAVWEEDGGPSTQKVEFNVGYKDIKVGATFNIGNVDDLIYQIGLERLPFFSSNQNNIGNGLWDDFRVYSSGGVYWSLPWTILPKAY